MFSATKTDRKEFHDDFRFRERLLEKIVWWNQKRFESQFWEGETIQIKILFRLPEFGLSAARKLA